MSESEISQLISEKDWKDAAVVLKCLRKNLSENDLVNNRKKLLESGYRLFGLRVEGQLITVAGVTLSPHITRIRDFWLHDFATIEGMQSKGYGTKMIQFLKELARVEGFSRICLYTQIGNKGSQAFYDQKVSFDRYGIMYVDEL